MNKLKELGSISKDPKWIAAREASITNGAIVVKVQSVFMNQPNFFQLNNYAILFFSCFSLKKI